MYITKQMHLRNKGFTRSGLYEYISGVLRSLLGVFTTLASFHHTLVDAKYFVSDLRDLRYPTEGNSSQPFFRKYTTEIQYLESFTVLVFFTLCVNPCKNRIFFFWTSFKDFAVIVFCVTKTLILENAYKSGWHFKFVSWAKDMLISTEYGDLSLKDIFGWNNRKSD